jgi:hypothetical protein
MVWGGILFRHCTPLIIIDCILTTQRYIDEFLRLAVALLFAIHRYVTHFQQDNAQPLSGRLTTAFLCQQGINTLPLWEVSPDLSPMEHLWDQLGRAVRQGHLEPQTRQQLEAALQADWRNIPQVRIQCLISYILRRCRACVAAGGRHIQY